MYRTLDEFLLDSFFARVDAGEEMSVPISDDLFDVDTCAVCGCTDDNACDGGCYSSWNDAMSMEWGEAQKKYPTIKVKE